MNAPNLAFTKPPKTPQEHISQLQDRGLLIDDQERAEKYLTHIGYYRLSAYFIPFEKTSHKKYRNHEFKQNTHFSQILDLYIFDRKLRILVMEAIERIEVSIRASWANAITLENKDSHAYMSAKLFKNPWKHQQNLAKVTKDLSDSEEQAIKHYKKKYSQPFLPPTWAMVETLTFGSLSHWFSNTKCPKVKRKVAQSISLPSIEVIQSVLQSLSLVRNICAHHGRLWNRKLVKQLPNIKLLQKQMIFEQVQAKDKVQQQPSRKLFNYLIIINHLMNTIQPKTSWSQRLDELIETLPKFHHGGMGLPENWQGFALQQAEIQV